MLKKEVISPGKYSLFVYFQCLLLILDLLINTFSEYFWKNYVLFVLFDLLQLGGISTTMIISYCAYKYTNLKHFNSWKINLKVFLAPSIASAIYCGLTTLKFTYLVRSFHHHDQSKLIPVVTIVQQLMAPVYYYYVKRNILKLSDPYYYDEKVHSHCVY